VVARRVKAIPAIANPLACDCAGHDRASSISLMPEELEKSLTRQGLADVIAYLRGGL